MSVRWPGWILTLLLMLGVGYAATPWAVRQIVQIWLTDQGFQNPRVRISHPRWNELQINEISLSQENAERRIALDAGPITLRYHPAQLILQQRLKAILIPHANLFLSYKPRLKQPRPDATDPARELPLLPLLPTQLIGKLPAERLQVGQLDLRLNSAEGSHWQLRGSLDLSDYELNSRVHLRINDQPLGWSDLRFDHRQQFSLRMLHLGEQVIFIEGQLEPASHLQLQLRQQTDLARLRQWLGAFIPDVRQWPRLSGQLSSQGQLTLPWSLALENQRWLQQLQLEQTLNADISLPHPIPAIDLASLRSTQQLSLVNGVMTLTVAPDSQLRLTNNLSYQPVRSLDIQTETPLHIETPLASPADSQVEAARLSIRTAAVRLPPRTLSSTPVQLTLQPFTLRAPRLKGQLKIDRLAVADPDQPWPALSLSSWFELDAQQLETQFEINTQQMPLRLKGSASWYSQRQLADINWQLQPVALKNLEQRLARYLPEIPEQLRLSGGLLEHRGWGRWQSDQLTLTLRQRARDIAFEWDGLEGRQGEWRSELRLLPDGRWEDSGRVRLGLLDAGLPVEKLQGYYSLRQRRDGQLEGALNRAQLSLLGGVVNLEPISFRGDNDELLTTLELERLQLPRILALEKQPGLAGTGEISGTLPLAWREGKLTVSNGSLRSLPPGGRLQFNPAAGVAAVARNNPGLKMALEALENFHYSELEIGVNYQPDGTTLLNTRIKGNNPDWNNGRAVNLGINIEENIPKLLKTLQITDELTESLKKRYR